jgi:exopolysaccharide production protein ExoZ
VDFDHTSWRASQEIRDRLASVDVLRTCAFLLVVLCHFGGMVGPGFSPGSSARAICDGFVYYGSLGTNSFFLLAAFLLHRSLRKGAGWKDAAGRRFLKFYPGFVAILTLNLLLAPFAPVSKLPQDAAGASVYVAANLLLLPGLVPIAPIVSVAWSLGYVALGYCLVGALHRLCANRGWSTLQRGALWTAAAIAIWGAFHFAGFPYPRMMYFPIGGLLSEALPWIARQDRREFAVAAFVVVILAGAILPSSAGYAIGIALVAAVAFGSSGLPSSTLTNLFADLSKISYAVFLSHGLVLHLIQAVRPATETLTDLAALLLGTVSLVLVVAIAFYTLVLEPMRIMLAQRAWSHGTRHSQLTTRA